MGLNDIISNKLNGNYYLKDEKILSLLGTNLDKLSQDELRKLCQKILKSKIHGICFSLYEGTQQPGDIVSDNQIIRRLEILKPYTSSIRTFSSLDEHARIVQIAKDMGFKTLVGAWLSDDMQSNENEIDGLIKLANNNLVDVAAVGNEVIYRKELEENQLISYINYVKENIEDIPVGYVDAYYEFEVFLKSVIFTRVVLRLVSLSQMHFILALSFDVLDRPLAIVIM